ncbi:MAG TPA: helix-turn-helix domain-containing protein, partial [Nannocystaceae bacterium]|nr:helix-turn-helix domain-containing protein [Nannocystaceae bacterium]
MTRCKITRAELSAMVWNETNPVNERRRFIEDHQSQHWTMVDLCERYGISRNTGYELLKRYASEGEAAFEERSRAPNTCPHRTPIELEQMIIEERLRCRWGARKLKKVLE